jgi:hypothetical protein
MRKVFDDTALVSLFLLAPQPLYYIVGESIKLSSDYSDLYYPNIWQFIGQMIFIGILYTPSFGLVYFNRRMVRTCIRRKHPDYDFKNMNLPVKRHDAKLSPRASSALNDDSSLLVNTNNGSQMKATRVPRFNEAAKIMGTDEESSGRPDDTIEVFKK